MTNQNRINQIPFYLIAERLAYAGLVALGALWLVFTPEPVAAISALAAALYCATAAAGAYIIFWAIVVGEGPSARTLGPQIAVLGGYLASGPLIGPGPAVGVAFFWLSGPLVAFCWVLLKATSLAAERGEPAQRPHHPRKQCAQSGYPGY